MHDWSQGFKRCFPWWLLCWSKCVANCESAHKVVLRLMLSRGSEALINSSTSTRSVKKLRIPQTVKVNKLHIDGTPTNLPTDSRLVGRIECLLAVRLNRNFILPRFSRRRREHSIWNPWAIFRRNYKEISRT